MGFSEHTDTILNRTELSMERLGDLGHLGPWSRLGHSDFYSLSTTFRLFLVQTLFLNLSNESIIFLWLLGFSIAIPFNAEQKW